MTREQAIKIISYHKILVDKDTSGLLNKQLEYQAIDMAIKALEQEPTTKEEAYNKGYADGVKSVNICPHCGEYIGEEE